MNSTSNDTSEDVKPEESGDAPEEKRDDPEKRIRPRIPQLKKSPSISDLGRLAFLIKPSLQIISTMPRK